MTIVVALLLAIAGFAFVAYPLLKPRPDAAGASDDVQDNELGVKKDTTYSMIKELEFDYQSGILSEEDYRDLQERYKRKAISLLKEADQAARGPGAGDDELEKEILRLRRGKVDEATVSPEDAIEEQVQQLRQRRPVDVASGKEHQSAATPQRKKQFCTQCGARVEEGDRFCSQCGAGLT